MKKAAHSAFRLNYVVSSEGDRVLSTSRRRPSSLPRPNTSSSTQGSRKECHRAASKEGSVLSSELIEVEWPDYWGHIERFSEV